MKKRLFEVGLAAAVIAVVVMMIVPLTPVLLDFLISLNLGLSVLVLSLSLFIRRPLGFTAFPTLLLVSTLYRLALNISSTRLILLRADAGRIIGGFGGYIVGGDILVGAVIFGILAMVLFLVITKGAERVAEVAARFTLDSLPGLQLAIDSDQRTGVVSPLEAGSARRELEIQSRYYGSLDGAMKFVRGDAIAGLVIVCVNIIGGLAVGILRHNMTMEEAFDTYGRLTIGDGLVTMIPALLVSTAAGLLVTRVGQDSKEGRLGQQLGEQMFSEPRAMGVAAILLLFLCFVPELPMMPFLLLGSLLAGIAVTSFLKEKKRAEFSGEDLFDWGNTRGPDARAVLEFGSVASARLEGEVAAKGGWQALSRGLAAGIREELSVPIGKVPVFTNTSKEDAETGMCLRVLGVRSNFTEIPPSAHLVLASAKHLETIGINPMGSPFQHMFWIGAADSARARDAGFRVESGIEAVRQVVLAWLRAKAGMLFGLDDVQRLVDDTSVTRPVLVRETIPRLMGLPALFELLRSLVSEGIPLGAFGNILEVIATEKVTEDREDNLQQVRLGLSHVITGKLLGEGQKISVSALSRDLESILDSAIVKTAAGSSLALDRETCLFLVRACEQATCNMETPVLLVNPHHRNSLAKMMSTELPRLRVVAHGEIAPNVPVEIAHLVDF